MVPFCELRKRKSLLVTDEICCLDALLTEHDCFVYYIRSMAAYRTMIKFLMGFI